MGNGIAHVFAMRNYNVNLIDISQEALEKAIVTISHNLDRMVKKELITETKKSSTIAQIQTITDLKEGVKNADLVIEANLKSLKSIL